MTCIAELAKCVQICALSNRHQVVCVGVGCVYSVHVSIFVCRYRAPRGALRRVPWSNYVLTEGYRGWLSQMIGLFHLIRFG